MAFLLLQYTQEMILKRVRVLSKIGDAMRLLCCLLLLWSVLISGCGGPHDAAVGAIKELDGHVTYDEKNPSKPVVGVSLSGQEVTDASLEHLKNLTDLQSLTLWDTKVTDAGLEHLKELAILQTLNLWDTKVTDSGLVNLKGITFLESLGLDGTQVTDVGLEHLKGKSLQELSLSRTEVTDAGLVHLKDRTSLQSLYLQGTSVTTAGVADLQSALPKCRIDK